MSTTALLDPTLPKELPPEDNRWNWGAFLLSWIWGVGNGTYIALLALVPVVGFVMLFVLGAKGSAWAWRNGTWRDLAHFRRVQRKWAIWGVVLWASFIALGCVALVSVFALLRQSDAYQLGLARLEASAEIREALGAPVSYGSPMGSISVSPSSGQAELNFSATGPKASGRVFLRAEKRDGAWALRLLRFPADGRTDTIDLLKDIQASPEPVLRSRSMSI